MNSLNSTFVIIIKYIIVPLIGVGLGLYLIQVQKKDSDKLSQQIRMDYNFLYQTPLNGFITDIEQNRYGNFYSISNFHSNVRIYDNPFIQEEDFVGYAKVGDHVRKEANTYQINLTRDNISKSFNPEPL